MIRVAAAAATQVGEEPVAFAPSPIVRMDSAHGPLSTAYPGQQQAGENGVNHRFGHGLHSPPP